MSVYKTLWFLLLFPSIASAAAGISPERIWTSKENLVAGETIRVSTVIENPFSREFRGTVQFWSGTTSIGSKAFLIPPESASIVSIDWLVPPGKHRLSANIQSPTLGTSTSLSTSMLFATSGTIERFAAAPPQHQATVLPSPTSTSPRTRISVSGLPEFLQGPVSALEEVRLTQADVADALVQSAAEALRASLSAKRTSPVTSDTPFVRGGEVGWQRQGAWVEIGRAIDSGDLLQSPFGYVRLFAAACYQWIVERLWAFALLGVFLVVTVVRILSSVLFR
jgi:hypothetical protein